MFPNLEAEQARHGMTNEAVASLLGVSRQTYELRKSNGQFSIANANFLCDFFKCAYRYLFAEEILIPTEWEPDRKKIKVAES